MRLEFLQPDLVGDVVEFLTADIIEVLATRLEFFVDLDGFLGHLLVRVLGTADEREIIALGDAFAAIRIQAEAEDSGFAFLFGVGH